MTESVVVLVSILESAGVGGACGGASVAVGLASVSLLAVVEETSSGRFCWIDGLTAAKYVAADTKICALRYSMVSWTTLASNRSA